MDLCSGRQLVIQLINKGTKVRRESHVVVMYVCACVSTAGNGSCVEAASSYIDTCVNFLLSCRTALRFRIPFLFVSTFMFHFLSSPPSSYHSLFLSTLSLILHFLSIHL
jgi:hypothetical protein